MDKPAIKKVLAKQIKVVISVETVMAISRWKRAKALSEMHSMVVWDKSPYKTFRKFIEQEFPDMDSGSAFTWAVNYNQMRKWYTWIQIQKLAKHVSYSRSVKTQQSMHGKSKLPLLKFISAAKNFKYTNVQGTKATVPNENRVTFILPVLYVEKLESLLAPHGYYIPKTKYDPKVGISDAMVKYLDTV